MLSKKCSYYGKYMDTLIASAVAKELNMKKQFKSKDKENFNLYYILKNYNFEKIGIRDDYELELELGREEFLEKPSCVQKVLCINNICTL